MSAVCAGSCSSGKPGLGTCVGTAKVVPSSRYKTELLRLRTAHFYARWVPLCRDRPCPASPRAWLCHGWLSEDAGVHLWRQRFPTAGDLLWAVTLVFGATWRSEALLTDEKHHLFVHCPYFSCMYYAQNWRSFCQTTLGRLLLTCLEIWLRFNIFLFLYLIFST